jgi:hypothetical protein
MWLDKEVDRLIDSIVDIGGGLWRALVIRPMLRYQAWRCQRAKDYLLRHDLRYRQQHIDNEVVRRHSQLYSAGVSPADPFVPDRWTVEDEMPRMAWPNKSWPLG